MGGCGDLVVMEWRARCGELQREQCMTAPNRVVRANCHCIAASLTAITNPRDQYAGAWCAAAGGARTNGSALFARRVPRTKGQNQSRKGPKTTPRRVFANAHAYHINSISTCSDGECFLSADDLRVNLWNLAVSDTCFTVVDMKPQDMESLSEVLTAACFHPTQSHIFAYSTSTGAVRLADMRAAALCDNSAKEFKDCTSRSAHAFFAEILECISDIKFTQAGHQLLMRDYMSLKLWDARMVHMPVLTMNVQEYLRLVLRSTPRELRVYPVQ